MAALNDDRYMHTSIQRSSSGTNALLNLFIYSCAMFTLPFVAFYGAIYVAEEYFGVTDSAYLWGTAAAVVTVHVLIGMFIWGAYKEVKEAEIAKEPRVVTKEELATRQKRD